MYELTASFLLFFHSLVSLKVFGSNPEDFESLGQTCSSVALCPVKYFQQNFIIIGKRMIHVALFARTVSARTWSPTRDSAFQRLLFP